MATTLRAGAKASPREQRRIRRAKQGKCPHPPEMQRPGVDPRYELCLRCGQTRAAPITAPWIIEYDTDHPTEAPVLFPSFQRGE